MSISKNDFLTDVWSQRINDNLRLNHILAQGNVVNRNYQVDTDNARRFHVHTLEDSPTENYNPSIDSNKYDANDDIQYNALNARRVTGELDQIKMIPWLEEDIDKMQSNTAYANRMQMNAAYRLSEAIEQYIAAQLEGGITDTDTTYVFKPSDESGYTTTAGYTLQDFSSTSTGALVGGPGFLNAVIKAKVQMTKVGVPEMGRVLIVPPEFQHTIWRSPTLQKSTESSERRNANGWIGRFMGFDVFESTYCVDDGTGTGVAGAGSKTWAVATHPELYTFALQQPIEFEMQRSERRYGTWMRATAVYGGVYLNRAKPAISATRNAAGKPGACKILVDTVHSTQDTDDTAGN